MMLSTNPKRLIQLALVIFSLTISALPSPVQSQSYYQAAGDPLGSFEGPGPSVPLNLTGVQQRIGNPSFGAGTISGWLQSQSNAAAGSSILVVSPGQDDSWSVLLSVQSGNVTSESQVSLFQDLSGEQVGFGASVRLKASIYLGQVTGTGQFDRAEVSVILSTSLGQTRTIHYYYGTAPANGTSDAYFAIGGVIGQWILTDRNLATDAAARFSADYTSLSAVREVRVSVLSRTIGNDPRIMYFDTNGDFSWGTGEPVVYDTDRDRRYDSATETVISGTPPTNQALLQDDPKTRFVDSNSNGNWDSGESIIYDSDNDNTYDTGEPAIAVPPPIGTAFNRTSTSRFDDIELYSTSGNYQWVRNNGFEGSLSGWGNYAVPVAFQAVTSRAFSGAYSARGSVTGGTVDMSQSFDAAPAIDSRSTFRASAYVETMSGTSSADYVDVWIGLADDSTTANPAFVHYFFNAGNGIVPANTTDAVHHAVTGFGTLGQWVSVNSSLSQEISYFSTTLYTLPFHAISVTVEVSAQASSTTTSYFDAFSLLGPYRTASSYRYAMDLSNSTYIYTATSVPQGAFSIDTPPGQSVLNITGPGGLLQPGEYTANALTGRVDIPNATSFQHPAFGTWRVTTTSFNAVFNAYVEDPATGATTTSVGLGSPINLVSRSLDPFGNPLSAANVSLTFWTSAGVLVGAPWTGTSNSQGWFNITGVTLSTAGVLRLQATTSASHVGVRTFPVSVLYPLSISISLSTSQIEAGSSVTISGVITPPRQGVTLTVQYRPAGISTWTNLSTVQTDANGRYSFAWKPSEGLFQVRVSATDPQTISAISTPAEISVSPNSLLDEIFLYGVGAALAAGVVVGFLFFRKRRAQRKAAHAPSAS